MQEASVSRSATTSRAVQFVESFGALRSWTSGSTRAHAGSRQIRWCRVGREAGLPRWTWSDAPTTATVRCCRPANSTNAVDSPTVRSRRASRHLVGPRLR